MTTIRDRKQSVWRAVDQNEVPLPVQVPGITVSAMWHPKLDADPQQRWFREMVFSTVRSTEAGRCWTERKQGMPLLLCATAVRILSDAGSSKSGPSRFLSDLGLLHGSLAGLLLARSPEQQVDRNRAPFLSSHRGSAHVRLLEFVRGSIITAGSPVRIPSRPKLDLDTVSTGRQKSSGILVTIV